MNTNETSDTVHDSWSITDSCRLIANAMINPQNSGAQNILSLMLQHQLENLEAALMQPVPEHRKHPEMPADDGLFDYTGLEPSELCDQCMALNYALMTLHDRKIKEILAFILWERFEMLRSSLYTTCEEAA